MSKHTPGPCGDDGIDRSCFMTVHYRPHGKAIPSGLLCREKLFSISAAAYIRAPKTTDVREVTCRWCKDWLAIRGTGSVGFVVVKTYEDGKPIRVDSVLYDNANDARLAAQVQEDQDASLDVDHWRYEVHPIRAAIAKAEG